MGTLVSDDGKANTTAARSTEPLGGKETTVLMEADESFPDLHKMERGRVIQQVLDWWMRHGKEVPQWLTAAS